MDRTTGVLHTHAMHLMCVHPRSIDHRRHNALPSPHDQGEKTEEELLAEEVAQKLAGMRVSGAAAGAAAAGDAAANGTGAGGEGQPALTETQVRLRFLDAVPLLV